jgi:tRNA(Arg) A34 adenosine deaminase TadA
MISPAGTTPPAATIGEHDRRFIAHVLHLAQQSRAAGRHPFAALVVDAAGSVVAECINNSMPPEGDPTQHAERLAAAEAARLLSPQKLAKATLYTSAEPCAMCAGAIYWCNIGRVVYVMSEEALLQLTGSHPENPTLSLPCREVFARGQRRIDVIGPLPEFEAEAARAHHDFWK